ncbi:uncharacterized protein LOC134284153 [Aedes albopictus]|uniref:Secreted protein n=1 Tax=Aedes albopictus TaxID=7160 RepID=A0ABM2A2R5_AEDAL
MSPLSVLISLLLLTASAIALSVHIHFDRFVQSTGFDVVNATGVRVRKYNRTTTVLDGEGELFRNLDDDYRFTLTVAYSRMGNNQFDEYPLKIAKATICSIMNGPYKDYQYLFKDYSNMPQVGDERFCPFPPGRYWVKNWAIDGSFVPPVVPSGYWRFTSNILDSKDKVVVQYLAYFHISKDMF